MGTRPGKRERERERETERKKEFRRTLCRCVDGTREGKKTLFWFFCGKGVLEVSEGDGKENRDAIPAHETFQVAAGTAIPEHVNPAAERAVTSPNTTRRRRS